MAQTRINPVRSLRALAAEAVTVGDLVSAPIWCIEPDASASDAAKILRARDFDLAGVTEEPVHRYVTVDELEHSDGLVADVARPLLATDVIERRVPLAEAIGLLGSRSFVFVLDDTEVRWLLTPADLHAPVVSIVVLAHLIAIESALMVLVPRRLGPSWLKQLAPNRRTKAHETYERKRQKNEAIGIEECLFFVDWINLAGRSESLRTELGFASRRAYERQTDPFIELRNDLAHGGSLLDQLSPRGAADVTVAARELTRRAWSCVDELRDEWDTYLGSQIVLETGDVLAGEGSLDQLPWRGPVHVISAWNPGGSTRSREANNEATAELRALLDSHEHEAIPIKGSAPDGAQVEHGYLVIDMNHRAAAEVGDRFGQLAIFELTNKEVRIVRCSDAKVVRRGPRRRA